MKYRKKPVEVEAWHFTDEMKDRVYNEVRQYQSNIYASFEEKTKPCLMIPTLEGEMRASIGDYIIKGVNGEFYPCKADIFEKTYEATDGICVGNHVISSNGDYGIVTRINAETNKATVCTIINQSGGASFTTYDNYKDKLKLVD